MALKLTILSHPHLPTGGATTFRLPDGRGADIGREPYMDWVLPDAQRHISGHHCEIRWEDKDFLLYDISRNGTFLNGAPQRLSGPHRLAHGDQISIGPYLIAVTLEGAGAVATPAPAAQPDRNGSWPEADAWSLPSTPPPTHPMAASSAPVPPIPTDPFPPETGSPPPFALPAALSAPAARPSEGEPLLAGRAQRGASIWDSPLRTPAPATPASAPQVAGVSPMVPPPPKFSAPPAPDVPDTPPPVVVLTPAPVDPPVSTPRRHSPAPGTSQAPSVTDAGLLDRLAAAAGVPAQVFAQRQPGEVMDDVGAQLAMTVARLMRLLAARTETKQAIRSGRHTQIRAVDNNPLKFSPTPGDAMRLMLGPPLRSYLDGRRALDQAFSDLENHQLRIFAAMQQALTMLLEDLDPEALERTAPVETGVFGRIGNRRARLWQHYSTVWTTLSNRNDDGLVGVFMDYFARCYDDLESSDPR